MNSRPLDRHSIKRSAWNHERNAGKLILSLDGGGMRGLSSLFILRGIMEELRDPSKKDLPLPCECFDLICGTGMGGLIALMLGRLRMRIEDCIKEYQRIARKVFHIPIISVRRHFKSHKCNPEAFKKYICEAIQTSTISRGQDISLEDCEELFLWDKSDKRVNTVVIARKASVDDSVKLRSYYITASTVDSIDTIDFRVWQAGRATAVCQKYLPPFNLRLDDSTDLQFSDVGKDDYNPSTVALEEARRLQWTNQDNGNIACFLSIGTGTAIRSSGMPKDIDLRGGKGGSSCSKSVEYHLDIISKCEDTHRRFHRSQPNLKYWRLNIPDIGKLGLDEHKYRHRIEQETLKYLGDANVKQNIKRIVQIVRATKPDA